MVEANTVTGSLGVVVAERTLTLVGRPSARVLIVVGKPRKDRRSGDAFCPYRIEGVGDEQLQQAGGIDSVQALQSAMQAVRAQLEPHADKLEWAGRRGPGQRARECCEHVRGRLVATTRPPAGCPESH